MTCLARSWSPVMEEVSAFGVCGPAAKTARARQAARTAQAQRGEEAARRPDRRGRMGARGGRGRGAHGARLPRHPRRDDPATRLTHVGPARHKSAGRAPEDPDERVDEPLVRSRGDHRPDGEEGGDDEPDRGAGEAGQGRRGPVPGIADGETGDPRPRSGLASQARFRPASRPGSAGVDGDGAGGEPFGRVRARRARIGGLPNDRAGAVDAHPMYRTLRSSLASAAFLRSL